MEHKITLASRQVLMKGTKHPLRMALISVSHHTQVLQCPLKGQWYVSKSEVICNTTITVEMQQLILEQSIKESR